MTTKVDCTECTGDGFHRIEEDRHEYEHVCYACRGTGLMTQAEAAARMADEDARAAADAEFFRFARGLMDGGGDYTYDPAYYMTADELAEAEHWMWHAG